MKKNKNNKIHLQNKFILSKTNVTFLTLPDDEQRNTHSEDTVNHNDRDVNNQHLSKDSIYEPINPDSQEGRVNERIKDQTQDFVFGAGLQEVKF